MKTTYLLQDGGTITATCAADFVTRLREGSRFDYDCTDQEYMYRFADRYFDQTGHTVRADSPEHFLADLLASGYVDAKK
jgi:hypothetical protein